MFQDKYVFAQLTAFLNRTQFNNYVRKYDGNRYVKHFTCWNQLLTSSLRHPKIFVKEFSDFLMSCHQHCLGVNLLVQR